MSKKASLCFDQLSTNGSVNRLIKSHPFALSRSKGACVAIIFLLAMFFPAGAAAQTANLAEQARKEGGEVVLYTTMPVTLFDIFQKAAKEKYPFLNIRHTYLS